MLRIPQHCIHTRSTPFWNKDTSPPGIFQRHLDKGTRPGVYPRLSVMRGAVRYLGFADSQCPEPESELIIHAGHFGVFPPEKWHCIALMSEDTLYNIEFFVEPDVLNALYVDNSHVG